MESIRVSTKADKSPNRHTDTSISAALSAKGAPCSPLQGQEENAHPRAWLMVTIALAVLGLLAAYTQVGDEDLYWHLAAGDWMLAHHTVITQDYWSTDSPRPWVNVHWLFQAVLAVANAVGGYDAMVIMKMVLLAGLAVALARLLRPQATPGVAILLLIVTLYIMQGRARVRPEMFTMLYLVLTMIVMESVRRGGSAGRMWWLAPLMAVWVNMHGVFVLGLVLIWSAVIGAWADRLISRTALTGNLASGKAALIALAATLACLVSPWPVEAFFQPVVLWQRVNGHVPYYTYGVSELAPTWQHLAEPLGAMSMGLVALAGAAMLASIRRAPLSHFLWLIAFAVLGLTAIRNTAFTVLVAGPLAAIYISGGVRAITGRWQFLRAATWPAVILLSAGAVLLGAGYATGWLYARQNRTERPGIGLMANHFPLNTAKRIAEVDGAGAILTPNFGDAGAFIYFAGPSHKMYMDGRLELNTLQRFKELYDIRSALVTSVNAAQRAPLPAGVKFIVVGFGDESILSNMARSPRYRLWYMDINHACFVLADSDVPAGNNLAELDKPLPLEGPAVMLPPGEEIFRWKWYQQNPPSTHRRVGAALRLLGQTSLAVRYLEASERLGELPAPWRRGMLAQAHLDNAKQGRFTPTWALPADMDATRALWISSQPQVCSLEEANGRAFDIQRIGLLVQSNQFDIAHREMVRHLENLPVPARWDPPADVVTMRDTLFTAMEAHQVQAGKLKLDGLRPVAQAMLLADAGLPLQAIERLKAMPTRDREVLIGLGDLYLRQGEVSAAREAYGSAQSTRELGDAILSPAAITMRQALCDWAEGDFSATLEQLRQAEVADPNDLSSRFYRASLLEMIGRYSQASDLLNIYHPAADYTPRTEVRTIAKQLAERLTGRGYVTTVP